MNAWAWVNPSAPHGVPVKYIDNGVAQMPVIYIAGPYRAASRAGIDLNIQTARRVGGDA